MNNLPRRIVSESEFVDTCRTKCVQIQNNQFKSSIAMRSLRISNHNDEILAQFVWHIRPITIVQAIAHMFVAFGRQFTKIAVQKEICEGHWCHKKQKNQLKIGIFHLLQQQNKRILMHSRFCAWFFQLNGKSIHQIQLEYGACQKECTANQANQNDWTVQLSGVGEPAWEQRYFLEIWIDSFCLI